MEKFKLIKLLEENRKCDLVAPALKRLASELEMTENIVRNIIDKINDDGIYRIYTIRGGGYVIEGSFDDENSTYKHIEENIEKWIEKDIYGKHGTYSKYLKKTHAKKLSGKWSTPDFVLACVHKFANVPQKLLELVSVEVKHANKQFDATCVYEALAHTRAAHYGVLFFYEDPSEPVIEKNIDTFEEIKVECARNGIGLVVSQYPCDLNNWQYIIPVKEHKPDLRRIEAFIEEAFEDKEKTTLKKEF